LGFEIQIVKYRSMAWDCEALVSGVESAPGGVDDILGGVGGPFAGDVPCGTGGIDASEEDGDKTTELVLECAGIWLGVLGLYYSSRLS